MDVSKWEKKPKNVWIFDDTFNTRKVGCFLDCKPYLTNGGKNAEAMYLAIDGTDYMIMPFKLDYTDFVEKYGSDTDKWKGHQFELYKNEKGKYTIVSIEEDI